jgi:hypothetical protein
MGGTTPAHGLPYPTGGDRVAEGDNAIQALAVKVDSELTERDSAITSLATKVDQRARYVAAPAARYVAATFSIPAVSAGASSGPQVVTFPAGSGFTSPPVVVASANAGRLGLAVTATTTTTFTYVADNWSPGASGSAVGRYVAVGPGA